MAQGALLLPPAAAPAAAVIDNTDRLCLRWLRTRWPSASADMSDSSPASTVAATIRASCFEFSPGVWGWEPRTPRS